ncbi:unnamed protein product [Sphenostylis stenocarpa]|uniref:Uncharacterized protein n=1 Tax=Sphenostylis stenocarpa TaxID=92480 RepID=A0AA86T356_9FABA|nr:unnamed protein product [Sphenostylis stenocarpa]
MNIKDKRKQNNKKRKAFRLCKFSWNNQHYDDEAENCVSFETRPSLVRFLVSQPPQSFHIFQKGLASEGFCRLVR